jgi:hypothetical protein
LTVRVASFPDNSSTEAGENYPDPDTLNRTNRKKIGTASPEELDQIIVGLDEIIGG